MAKILVVGSMNMDIVTQVERHPVPGETIQGNETRFFIGGKGANQAVAASRSGASVAMAVDWARIPSAPTFAGDWQRIGLILIMWPRSRL